MTGYCASLGNAMISWKSKKLDDVSRSIVEDQNCSMGKVTSEVVWLRGLEQKSSTVLKCDNKMAIKIAANHMIYEQTKCIENDCHFVRNMLVKGVLETEYVALKEILALAYKSTGQFLRDLMAPCTDPKPVVRISYDREDKAVDSAVRHILNHLSSDGIVYNSLDFKDFEPGKPINPTLQCLIEQCIIYIVIFSKNYPASSSRLLELAMIVEAVAATSDKYLLPVFYGAGTDDVKLKTEKYNEQLRLHFPGQSEATLQKWKDALLAAARICGFDQKPTEGRICTDADLCSQIVDRVLDLIKVKDATSLTTATIRGCRKLQSAAGLRLGSTSPTYLTIEDSGIHVLFDPSQRINRIVKMTLLNCDNLKEISLEPLNSLEELVVEGCSSIVSLSGVDNAVKLQKLHVRSCQNLSVIDGYEGVKDFSIHDCDSLLSLNSKISMDKSEMQQPISSQEASSSSSPTQHDDAAEKLIVDKLSQFL